jgi:hypothetical protein
VRARDERDPKIAAILVADVVGYSRLAGARGSPDYPMLADVERA